MTESESGFNPVGVPTVGIRDPLADRAVTITIQAAPPPVGGSRDERACLVAVGVVGSVPSMGEGHFGDLAALIRQVWNAHTEATAAVESTPPAAPGVLAEQPALPVLETTDGELLAHPPSTPQALSAGASVVPAEQPRLAPAIQAAPPPPQEDLLDLF